MSLTSWISEYECHIRKKILGVKTEYSLDCLEGFKNRGEDKTNE